MATKLWLGTADAVAQISTCTPANVEVGDVFKVDLSNDAGDSYEISFTATAATVQNVVEGLKAAGDAAKTAAEAPWDDVTCSEDDTKLTITADTAGVPFYVTTSTVEGGGNDTQTLTAATPTANSGPNDWNTADNWSTGAVPVNADDVYLEDSEVEVLYGLDQSAVALTSLTIKHSYEGKVGQATAYLQIAATTVNIGEHWLPGNPTGAGRIKLNLGSTASTVTVSNSRATASDENLPAIRLLCNNASTKVYVQKGKVGIAIEDATETSTLSQVIISHLANVTSDADVIVGAGVTLTALLKTGGQAVLLCGATTVRNDNGTLTIAGTGAITTLDVYGGTVYCLSTGTITNLNCYGGRTDFLRSSATRTVTTPKIWAGAVLAYDLAFVTMTNKPSPQERLALTASQE